MDGCKLANQTSDKRRDLDFYPTPPDVTHALMKFLDLPKSIIWEPACGDGSMAAVIMSYGHEVIATDLRHTGFGEGGIDFLKANRNCNVIITNPPFNLSEKFIRHALNQAKVVAMLLKSQYWHASRRLSLFNGTHPAYVLPLTWRPDFLNGQRGGAPTMEVHWTVWIAGEHDTRMRLLSRPDCQLRLSYESTDEAEGSYD